VARPTMCQGGCHSAHRLDGAIAALPAHRRPHRDETCASRQTARYLLLH
jgi:hypothetical protein